MIQELDDQIFCQDSEYVVSLQPIMDLFGLSRFDLGCILNPFIYKYRPRGCDTPAFNRGGFPRVFACVHVLVYSCIYTSYLPVQSKLLLEVSLINLVLRSISQIYFEVQYYRCKFSTMLLVRASTGSFSHSWHHVVLCHKLCSCNTS